MARVLATVLHDYALRRQTPPAATPKDALDLSEYEPEAYEIADVEPALLNPISLEIERAIRKTGMTEAEVARRMGTSRASLTRITDPFYWGHSLSMLRRFAEAVGAEVKLEFPPKAA
jgi:antitoxin component HigA of HigAB toxin-antitoxin module